MKNIIIIVLTIIVLVLSALLVNEQFLATKVEEKSADASVSYDFYKHINSYISLLPEDKQKKVADKMEKISEDLNTEDSDIQKAFVFVYASQLNNDPEIKEILEHLKEEVDSKKETSKNDEVFFSKNTECAKLNDGIKAGLDKKYTSSLGTVEDEELNFIFYSPTFNACMYVTNYSYSYSDYKQGEYYSRDSYRVYNVSSEEKLNEYPKYYSLDYPYISSEEASKSVKQGQMNYAKFILENSGYNESLLKGYF